MTHTLEGFTFHLFELFLRHPSGLLINSYKCNMQSKVLQCIPSASRGPSSRKSDG